MKTKTKEIAPTAGVNKTGRTRLIAIFRWPLLLALFILPQMVQAQWTATVGAQTDEKGIQALAFLPNEIWIHAGDRITWTFQADETHTVLFSGPPRCALISMWGARAFRVTRLSSMVRLALPRPRW